MALLFYFNFYAEAEGSDLPTFASDVCMRVHAFIAPFTIIIVLSFKDGSGERGNNGVFRSVMSGAKRNLFFFSFVGLYNISLGLDSNFSGKGKRFGLVEYLWVVFFPSRFCFFIQSWMMDWGGLGSDFSIFMIVVFRVIEHSDTRLCLFPLFSSYFIVFTQILAR